MALLAGGKALPRLHPLQHRGLAVANGPADPDVGWPVTPHARLGKPRETDFEELGDLLRRQQHHAARGFAPRAGG